MLPRYAVHVLLPIDARRLRLVSDRIPYLDPHPDSRLMCGNLSSGSDNDRAAHIHKEARMSQRRTGLSKTATVLYREQLCLVLGVPRLSIGLFMCRSSKIPDVRERATRSGLMCGYCDGLRHPRSDLKLALIGVVASSRTSCRNAGEDGDVCSFCVTYEPMLIFCVARRHRVR